MFKKNRPILLLFILYCCDSLWKFLHWHAYMNGLPMYLIAGALTVRFWVMGGLLAVLLRANRKRPTQSPTISPSQRT